MSGVRWGQTLNEQLKDEPAIRFWIINQKQLQDMGIPPELVTRYLDHPAFTPVTTPSWSRPWRAWEALQDATSSWR